LRRNIWKKKERKTVLDKSKNEIKKIDKNIGKIDVSIRDNIYEMGRLFYDENKGKSFEDSPYEKWMTAIGELEAEKQGLYREKLKLQGLMQCENCNSIISYGSTFCNHCGSKLEMNTVVEEGKHGL